MLSFSLASLALPRHFENSVGEGNWEFMGNRLACTLEQTIPFFGKVTIMQEHTKPEKMELQSWQEDLQGKFSKVEVFRPNWDGDDAKPTVLSKVPMRSGRDAIVLGNELTQRLLGFLSQGYVARFNFKSKVNNPIMVDVSSVNFQEAYSKFTDCQRHLLNFTLDDVKNTTIYFPVNGTRLTKADIDHILRIREYALADPKVTKVVIKGYSDEQGRKGHNNYLSELRAKAVYKYIMTDKMLPMNKIVLNWYGEKYPISENESEIGRALNRRVTIDLYVDYP